MKSIESLPNYNELLDRIRVIHSEGDSLYREFTIPDEEDETKAKNSTNNTENNAGTNIDLQSNNCNENDENS